jgi:hypothetical protein
MLERGIQPHHRALIDPQDALLRAVQVNGHGKDDAEGDDQEAR